MKTIKNYEEFGSSKSMISKAQNVLDQTIFKRGCCKKKKKKKNFLPNFHLGLMECSHLLQNLELALYSKLSDKKAN